MDPVRLCDEFKNKRHGLKLCRLFFRIVGKKKRAPMLKSAPVGVKETYFTMLATSSAKLSARFSMPSPFSKRTNFTTSILPPSSLAVLAIILSNGHVLVLDKGLLQ